MNQREGRGEIVHKTGWKYQHDRLYLIYKLCKTPLKTTFRVRCLVVIWSMVWLELTKVMRFVLFSSRKTSVFSTFLRNVIWEDDGEHILFTCTLNTIIQFVRVTVLVWQSCRVLFPAVFPHPPPLLFPSLLLFPPPSSPLPLPSSYPLLLSPTPFPPSLSSSLSSPLSSLYSPPRSSPCPLLILPLSPCHLAT